VFSGVVSSSPESTALISIFLLSSYAGQQAVYGVKPAFHSPLMAVTNAISGLTAIGGISLLHSEQSAAQVFNLFLNVKIQIIF
jgi:NAD(P) transhydrogenase